MCFSYLPGGHSVILNSVDLVIKIVSVIITREPTNSRLDCGSLDCVISRVVRESDLRSVCFSPSDSKAIVDGNLKLILGLIWTLILHYSISMPAWEGEDEEVTSGLVLLTSVHLKKNI